MIGLDTSIPEVQAFLAAQAQSKAKVQAKKAKQTQSIVASLPKVKSVFKPKHA